MEADAVPANPVTAVAVSRARGAEGAVAGLAASQATVARLRRDVRALQAENARLGMLLAATHGGQNAAGRPDPFELTVLTGPLAPDGMSGTPVCFELRTAAT